jgi:hypothetical protein
MKVIHISDELHDRLKNCVVDPFDDTPESVISRLIDIVDRAKKKWSPLDAHGKDSEPEVESQNMPLKRSGHWNRQVEPVL